MTAFKARAARMLPGGYSPVPIRPGTKRPLEDGWHHLRTRAMNPMDIKYLTSRNPDLGLGVVGGFMGLVPIDIDTEDPAIIDIVTSILPVATVAKTGLRGFTVFYRGKIKARKFKSATGMLVEVITTGQTVLPPTMHPGKKDDDGNWIHRPRPYTWLTDATLFNTRVSDLPTITECDLDRLGEALAPFMPAKREWEPQTETAAGDASTGSVSDYRMQRYRDAALRSQTAKVASAPNGTRNAALFLAVCSLGAFVHHEIIKPYELNKAMLGACQTNGLIKDDGLASCEKTIAKGMLASMNDEKPKPRDRPLTDNRWQQEARP